jgi:hypothetical protein
MSFLQDNLEKFASAFFLLGIIHTFLAGKILKFSHKFEKGTTQYRFFHLMGEAEIPLGLWAGFFCLFCFMVTGKQGLVSLLSEVNFVEPLFIFAILTVAATKPILKFTDKMIITISKALPLPKSTQLYTGAMIVGPLMGSFITEPAAMTVTALFLRKNFFQKIKGCPSWFKYFSLGLLFTNISIGGAMTNFAAPPVLVVAEKFGWSSWFMMKNFGWKVCLSVVIGTCLTVFAFWKTVFSDTERMSGLRTPSTAVASRIPSWVIGVQLFFLFLIVFFNHYPEIFLPIFVLFLGWCYISKNHQEELHLHDALVVTFFLGGLMIMGKQQSWWVSPVLSNLSEPLLFTSGVLLTAINDNASITYLASFVEGLSETDRYLIVAGALAGGGTTVIANAPNPAGIGLLRRIFSDDYGLVKDLEYNPEAQVSPLKLFLGAMPATLLASLLLYWIR